MLEGAWNSLSGTLEGAVGNNNTGNREILHLAWGIPVVVGAGWEPLRWKFRGSVSTHMIALVHPLTTLNDTATDNPYAERTILGGKYFAVVALVSRGEVWTVSWSACQLFCCEHFPGTSFQCGRNLDQDHLYSWNSPITVFTKEIEICNLISQKIWWWGIWVL